MKFIIIVHIILVIIGIIATLRLKKTEKYVKDRLTFSIVSGLADCLALGIISFLLINVGEYFNRGLISLINQFWYVYILILSSIIFYLFYHFLSFTFY